MGNSYYHKYNFEPTSHIYFEKYSKMDLSQVTKKPNPPNVANFDKEHVTISKIFKISLEKSDKFLFLELYLAELLSMNKEVKFRLANLDDIILSLLNTERREHFLDYLFEAYHRSIEMIEKRFRSEYDEKYKKIHQYISNYICLLMSCPENLEMSLTSYEAPSSFEKYIKDIDEDELSFLLYDLYNSTSTNPSDMRNVFKHFFRYIHSINIQSKYSFYSREKINKHLYILQYLFDYCPLVVDAFLDECNELKTLNARTFQKENYLSIYFDICPFEAEPDLIKKYINLNKQLREVNIVLSNFKAKINDYYNDLAILFETMYYATSTSKDKLLQWIYRVIKLNEEKVKSYHNSSLTSSTGFLLNVINVLLRCLFREKDLIESSLTYSQFVFRVVGGIDPLFTLKNNKINFEIFNRANPEIIKEIIKNKDEIKEIIPLDFNVYTELFFIIETIMAMTLKNWKNEIENLFKALNKLQTEKKTKEKQFKDLLVTEYAIKIYNKNDIINKYLLQFCEMSTFLLFSCNNKKYSQHAFNKSSDKIDYHEFLDDFFTYVDFQDNFIISLLPNMIYENVITIATFIRQHQPDDLMAHKYATKALVYFSLIFSCQNNLIQNPHFRMEIFEIMVNFFYLPNNEKNAKIAQIFELLKEKFIKDKLFASILRVFCDAERLGTSNQYYEKFNVRYKILLLVDNINRNARHLFVENIKKYADDYQEESVKMVNLLMSDISHLNDECIEKLSLIKKYQDLKSDSEQYNALNEEKKKLEEEKFQRNDKIVRADIQLFNSGLKFLVSISRVLQDKFLDKKFELGENLANLLNYSLSIFITKRGNEIKVKNLHEYEFNPKFVLASIISIYSSFAEYSDFFEYIVKDKRSYKFENFIRAKNMVEENKSFPVDNEDLCNFNRLIGELKDTEKDIASKEINYDDAPNNFIDPITMELMYDPVMLPSSKVIVDRRTIEKNLMSNQTDPFNRSKLTKDMLIPCNDLKKEINEYLNKKKKNE